MNMQIRTDTRTINGVKDQLNTLKYINQMGFAQDTVALVQSDERSSGRVVRKYKIDRSMPFHAFLGTAAIYVQEVEALSTAYRPQHLLARVMEQISEISNLDVQQRSLRLMWHVKEVLNRFERRGMDLSNLPNWYAAVLNDGGLSIEWIFNDFRIGFTVEKQDNDSGWLLVSTRKHGDISAYGYLSVPNLQSLIEWLLTFAIRVAQS